MYEQWVVGQPVVEGLHVAREFLVADTGPSRDAPQPLISGSSARTCD
jgi:hypothetical protein